LLLLLLLVVLVVLRAAPAPGTASATAAPSVLSCPDAAVAAELPADAARALIIAFQALA
jgi:hypothetical protein